MYLHCWAIVKFVLPVNVLKCDFICYSFSKIFAKLMTFLTEMCDRRCC